MTEPMPEKIAERIRHFQARAKHKDTPPEEAALAASRVAYLMERYALSDEAVRLAEGAPSDLAWLTLPVSGVGGHGRARVAAIASVCRALGCGVLVTDNNASAYDREVNVIGTPSMLERVRTLVPLLSAQWEPAAGLAAAQYRAQTADRMRIAGRSEGQIAAARAKYFRSFLRGFGVMVAERITAERQHLADEVRGTGAELVLVGDRARINAAIEAVKPRPARRGERVTRLGYADGQQAGREADLGRRYLDECDEDADGEQDEPLQLLAGPS